MSRKARVPPYVGCLSGILEPGAACLRVGGAARKEQGREPKPSPPLFPLNRRPKPPVLSIRP